VQPVKLIAPTEAARRTRAAIGYAGFDMKEVAGASGITIGTLNNIVSRTRPSGGTIERLWAIADACGVPRSFMEDGFTPDPPRSPSEQLDDLQRQIAELRTMVLDLADAPEDQG